METKYRKAISEPTHSMRAVHLLKHSNGPRVGVCFKLQDRQILSIHLRLSPSFIAETKGEGHSDLHCQIQKWLEVYLAGTPQKMLPFAWPLLTPFRKQVLSALPQIPFGQAISYGQCAEMIGSPLAARAVGNACGSNPFPLVIPCHRIIGAGQKIGGFLQGAPDGLEIKRRLLSFENYPCIL